jgi:ketosteroid isomerase-like protein
MDLRAAQNRRDIEAVVALVDEEHEASSLVHPSEAFRGREQVRKNRTALFDRVPDLRSELVRTAVEGRRGLEGMALDRHTCGRAAPGHEGVLITGIRDGRIVSGRLYVEQVEDLGVGIDEAVDEMAGGGS